MKCFIFVKAFSFGRQFFFWNGGALDGHHDSWQVHICSGEYFSSYISKFHCWFLQFQICLAKELGRDSTSTWRMQQKVAMTTVNKAGHFWHQYALLADWKRIILFLQCCRVQIRDSVSFWGPKAFSFGRCDQELKSKPWKKAKK